VSVEVLAGPVVAHRRAWVGVAGGDLDVAEADASVEHGRDEGVASVRTRRVRWFRVAIEAVSWRESTSLPARRSV
jgi:hypothetical protein